MPVYHTSDIANDAESNKYFGTPVGTLSTPAVLPRIVDGGKSGLLIRMGLEEPDVIFAGQGGGTAYADMQAAVGAWPNDTVAHCYAANSAQHGRYVRTAGAWVRSGFAAPLWEYDNNHMRVLTDYMLLAQTCFNTAHPVAANDGAGPFVDKVAYPNVTDMTNHIARFTIRAKNMTVPPAFKLGLHLQGQLAGVPRLGTGNSGAGAFPLVNAMNHADFMGPLGFGNGGMFADNTVAFVADSGWVEVDVPFSPSDAQWTMMCGNTSKDAHEGATYAENVHYIATSAKRLVSADLHKVNAYFCGFQWNTMPGINGTNTPRPRTLPEFEPTGDLMISKVEFISP